MKNRKLSARAVVSLMLSAILFCMPIGAFFANRTNTIEVHAEDTAEQKTESASDAENTVTPGNGREENSGTDTGEGKTENSTEGTTEDSSEETQPAAKCTCKEKCSQYAVDEDCEVCAKDYKECAYINPSVKITINTPSGWHNDTNESNGQGRRYGSVRQFYHSESTGEGRTEWKLDGYYRGYVHRDFREQHHLCAGHRPEGQELREKPLYQVF